MIVTRELVKRWFRWWHPPAPATPATVDPVPVEPYWRDNAPVTWPEGFKNGKPITAEAAIAVGEPSSEVAPVPTVKAAPKAVRQTRQAAATTKSTKPSASKVKKPKTKMQARQSSESSQVTPPAPARNPRTKHLL